MGKVIWCKRNIVYLLSLVGFLLCQTVSAQDWYYTVRPGDNLWKLSERYLRSVAYVTRLQAMNNISNPYEIPPGTRIRVPVAWLRSEPASAIIIQLSGEVRVIPKNGGQERVLSISDPLQTGDTIRTGEDASTVLRFMDGSDFVLRQNSTLVMERINAYTATGMVDTSLDLQSGRINGEVRPDSGAGTRFQIRTPAAQTAVRGTGYRVSFSDNTTHAEVLSGQVEVSNSGVTRVVPANFGTAVDQGSVPRRPRELLPPPDLQAVPPLLERLPLQLDWPDQTGAVQYRVQISTDASFNHLLVDERSSVSQLRIRDLPDGDYLLRLRSIDDIGLEGRDNVRPLEINARPEPPFIVGPNTGSIVRVAVPELRWTQTENATHYHLQVAMDEAFTQAVFEQEVYTSDRWQPQTLLAEGDYFWRIATIDRSGEHGPFSDTMQFALRPTPDPEPPTIGEDTIAFRWTEGLPGEQYHFQLARDRTFSEMIAEEVLTEPVVSLPKPIGGNTYYMRYSVIGTDNIEGPFSSMQSIYLPIDDYRPFGIFTTVLGLILLL